jgi:hypothetical protein
VVKTSGAQRNTFRRQPYAWLGAGALGVGLALAGAGTAHADDSVNDTASTAAASSTRAQGNAAAGAAAKSTSRSPVATSRPAGPRDSVKDGAGKRALTAANRSTLAVTPRVRSAVPVSAAASATAVVQSEAGDRPLGRTVVRAAAARAAAAQAAVTPAEAINAAVVDWFDSTSASLATLPRGPLNELASGALMLVRRSLFNQLPTAGNSVQLTTNRVGQVSGVIGATDPEGDPLTYTLTGLPEFGAVQITQTGEYTYSPGPDFAGIDSFSVTVRDGGFNLLNPLSDRAAEVSVKVPDDSLGPLVGQTTGFTIKNLSGQSVMLKTLQKEAGYENDVRALPAGTIVPIGGTYNVELTDYAFYEYKTRWEFAACVEVDCAGGKVSAYDTWLVEIQRGVIGFGGNYWAGCLGGGRCENNDGRGIDGYDRDYGWLYAAGNRTVVLVDSPGTTRTISGAEAETQGNIISAVCSTNGAYCSFVSNGPVTPSTIGKTKIFNNNSDGQLNITQTFTESIAAQSSTKFTYSQETSGNIGVKGAWGLAFKAAFGQELSSTNSLQTTTAVQINQVLPAWTRGIATVGAPADRVTGTYTAIIKNTEFTLTDVWFDFPKPQSTTQSYDWTTEEIKRVVGGTTSQELQ